MPQLLILRHAIAQERETSAAMAIDDFDRPLTEQGQKRMLRIAAGLGNLLPEPDSILSSPLLRARQTAELFAARYPDKEIEIVEELSSSHHIHQLIALLQRLQPSRLLAIVGHEPALSILISTLLSGDAYSFVQMKKGGAALLEFNDQISAGCGIMLWLLPPRLLRSLGDISAI